jgi:uncharacterized protein YndB with AHSA1/START domain
MFKFVALGILGALVLFCAYISTREGKFRYERSGVINAPPEKIFPYLVDFKKGGEWSPYEKVDPNMKKTYSGPEQQVGSVMEFDGNRDAGSGKLEILKIVPNESVEIRLTMIKPFQGENVVVYKLTPQADGTLFTWTMSGEGGFVSKLLNFFVDCEKMVADQFTVGINNLKQVVESQK